MGWFSNTKDKVAGAAKTGVDWTSDKFKEMRKDASNPTATPLYDLDATYSTYDDKYKVDQHMYPEDIEGNSEQYGFNYAVFYINVSEDSRLVKDPNSGAEFVKDAPPRIVSESTAQVQKKTSGQADIYAIGGSTVKGTALGTLLGMGGESALGKTAVAGQVIGTGAIALSASNFQNKTRRLKTAIKLHMPNQLNIRYNVNYQEEELLDDALAGTLMSGGAGAAMEFAANKDINDVELNEMTNKFASGIAAFAMQKDMAGSKMMSRLGRIAANPRKEQLFKNVDVRTFQIDYQFFPRSATEAEKVQNIIKTLKFHMHPEYKDANAFLYVYPSEFDIVYYHGTQENRNIHKHTSCVLTELSVNYTPQGRFNTFGGTDINPGGNPTQINVVMTFRELLPLTKETIKGGL